MLNPSSLFFEIKKEGKEDGRNRKKNMERDGRK